MNFGYREACLEHDPGAGHPERPGRLRRIRRALADCHAVGYAAPELADHRELLAVHDSGYVDAVESLADAGGGRWDADTIASEGTWSAARASAGIARWVAFQALAGADGTETPFGLSRPPGHHALSDDAMGFCFFNNAAIAAETGLRAGADRVAIVDWDVHHGNGTQELFYDRGDVFYASVHEADLYPSTGRSEETGVGPGAGTTLNVPLPGAAGDPGYRAVLAEAIGPAVVAFDPDVIVVSAGFDAHEKDPISAVGVSTEGYAGLAAAIRGVAADADAGLGFVLEGGYDLAALGDSVRIVNEVFGGYEPVAPTAEPARPVRRVLERVESPGT